MAKDNEPALVRLTDYRPPAFRITDVALHFDIGDGTTTVSSTLDVVRTDDAASDLTLDGDGPELVSVALDGRTLSGNEYRVDAGSLTLFAVPARARVSIVTRIHPETNTALDGLYRSGSMYCTQCEPEGFRKMTYYLDRPDVLAKFTTTIEADAARCPVLLSNGNLVGSAPAGPGRHRATWHDPFPKPAYLFALVAGDLARITDEFVTKSGRRVEIRIYSEPHNIAECDFAMASLKRAMRWDEDVYGREYDLDVFMIVAVDDFNMGAMENKGLNIFNTSCVLATPDTATDAGYRRVEAVVAHEYFHNWSGNRVTCRDWFQLSLKEGFTVFRDSQFSGDMFSPMVKRIEDVEFLRTFQFPEDAGPLAHPVRPESYLEISNFYTSTVYEKGAEVVRMIHTLLGPERFRRGTDLYFERHDGQAVTTEDFVRAMEDANGVDLRLFRRWYSQAGTPVLTVTREYVDDALTLTFVQRCPPTPGQPDKAPFHLPVTIGLLDRDGNELLGAAASARGAQARVESRARIENPGRDGTLVLHLDAEQAQVVVRGLAQPPAGASVLRGFSAPVRLAFARDDRELAFLAEHDTDGFSRWDAMRSLQCAAIERLRVGAGPDAGVIDLYGRLIEAAMRESRTEIRALYAEMLSLPTEIYVGDQMPEIDVDGVHRARGALEAAVGDAHLRGWRALYAACRDDRFSADAGSMAQRALRNVALAFLCAAQPGRASAETEAMLVSHLGQAHNLTDRLAAMREIASAEWIEEALRRRLLGEFYERWQHRKLVVDQWFTVQATAMRAGALDRVEALERHPAFDRRNPNRARALYGAFCNQNLVNFHALDGRGYAFLADRVIAIDGQNPQLAARLLVPMTRFRRYDVARQALMRAALTRIEASGPRSRDVHELVVKSLAGDQPVG